MADTTQPPAETLRAAQSYAFHCGLSDGRRDRLDGWANSSRAYRAGQVMSRVEREMTA